MPEDEALAPQFAARLKLAKILCKLQAGPHYAKTDMEDIWKTMQSDLLRGKFLAEAQWIIEQMAA